MVTDERLKKLALRHIGRYSGRISAGKRGCDRINLEECKQYMAIWKSILKKGSWGYLNQVERFEVRDAVGDEEDERL